MSHYRVLLPDVGSSSSQPLNLEKLYFIQALDVDLCVKSEDIWEDEFRHKVTITRYHTKHPNVDWVFSFINMNMNLSLNWHLNILKYLYWSSTVNVNLNSMQFLKFLSSNLRLGSVLLSDEINKTVPLTKPEKKKALARNYLFERETIYPLHGLSLSHFLSFNIYIYIYIHTHTHIYIYIYIYIYVYERSEQIYYTSHFYSDINLLKCLSQLRQWVTEIQPSVLKKEVEQFFCESQTSGSDANII